MDAWTRYSSYSRGDVFDRTIDTDDLQRYCPTDQVSLKTPSASCMRDATASLGRFDKLPVETTQNILSNLNLSTLTSLRSTSKRMNLLVGSLFPYKEVFTHAPNALRALLSTGATRYFTAVDLQNALRSQECFLCERFGAFLYLLECRRCCWHCLISSQDIMPMSKDAAQLLYHLDDQTMRDLPTIRSIPGPYGPKQSRRPDLKTKGTMRIGGKRIDLVSYGAARNAAAKLQALTDDFEKAKRETRIALRGPLAQDHMRDQDCMNYDPMGYKGGYGLEPQRFMAAVRFPTLLVAGTDIAVEWGVSCLGCLEMCKEGEEERLWNEQFTVEGLGEHLEECDRGMELWVGDRVEELNKRCKGVGVPSKRS